MTDENASAPVADLETHVTTPEQGEGQTDGQAAEVSEEEAEEKKSEAAKRRERDRAVKERLRNDAEAAAAKLADAEARRLKIVEAGKSEKAPTEADFTDYGEFIAAKAVWAAEQRHVSRETAQIDAEAEVARQQQAAIKAAEQARLSQHWAEQTTEAKARYSDFDQIVSAPGLFPVNTHLPELIVASETAADLAYAVARDRGLHDRLLAMTPIEAARELGRLEASLSAPKARTETKAPQPIAPVRGTVGAGIQGNPDKWSLADYRAAKDRGLIK